MPKIKDFTPNPFDVIHLEPMKGVEVRTKNTLTQENFEAQDWLSWFMSDVGNVQTRCIQIFSGNFDKTDSKLVELAIAAKKSLDETVKDIEKLKEFLATYTPPNN